MKKGYKNGGVYLQITTPNEKLTHHDLESISKIIDKIKEDYDEQSRTTIYYVDTRIGSKGTDSIDLNQRCGRIIAGYTVPDELLRESIDKEPMPTNTAGKLIVATSEESLKELLMKFYGLL